MGELEILDAWLGRLHDDVVNLAMDEFVFWHVQHIIEQNAELHVPSEFYSWIGRMYVAGMSMAIRRQTDDDSRTESFVRFLSRLKGGVGLISRTRYRRFYPKDQLGYADDVYDRFAGRGNQHPLPQRLDREIRTLRRLSRNVVAWADQVVAHRDRTPPQIVPTFGEVRPVIRYLERLIQRYYQLFRAVHWDPEVTIVYDWEKPFRVAWLPVGMELPNTRLHPTARPKFRHSPFRHLPRRG